MSNTAVMCLRWVRDLAFLALVTTTLLFLLLRLTGDPAVALAGPDATEEQLVAVRAEYGFDRSIWVQYGSYLRSLGSFDWGRSFADGTPALGKVLTAFPASLMLAALAVSLACVTAVPLGVWLGAKEGGWVRRTARGLVFALQGFPGFVVALILVQLFAIELGWLPALGYASPKAWLLPTISVASFLMPKLARMVEANVSAALASAYVRTARAIGASDREILWKHALPNALLGVTALVGAQLAFVVTGLVIIETLFAWPGIGWLLVQSTTALDFPVVQAITLITVAAVFVINALNDLVQQRLDPRLRREPVAAQSVNT